jgi:hypothetical protein
MTKKIGKAKFQKKTINAILVATAVVLFWRGSWGLLDHYLFPRNPPLSYITSLILGIIILVATHHLIDQLMP